MDWWILHLVDAPWGLALAIVRLPYLFSGNTDEAQALLMAPARQ
jgi:hypothetical protein